jgi:tRNA(Ile)-lysidine synthetase-like protein
VSITPAFGDVLSTTPASVLEELTRPWSPEPGDLIVVAASGGADSTALLHLLSALAPGRGWTIVVATLDHGVRGVESHADRRFVEELSRKLGLECVARVVSQRPSGRSSEERLRDLRRSFLLELASSRGAAAIALAHTADDQAETVLHRLARGAGLRGLGGMSRWASPLWRPALSLRRASLRGVLGEAGLTWREDASNRALHASRNRIRHLVIPALERALGPKAADGLARAARLAREDELLLSRLAREAMEEIRRERSASHVSLDRRALAALPAALGRRVVRASLEELLGRRQANASHVLDILELARANSSGARVDLPRGAAAERKRDLIVVRAGTAAPQDGDRIR